MSPRTKIKAIIQHHIDEDNATIEQCVINAAIEFPALFEAFRVTKHDIYITAASKRHRFKKSDFNYDPQYI